ncbi:MAG: hypothetical protein PSV35_03855, partial [bacterium]|nr:hypothetical protein [bacterium]
HYPGAYFGIVPISSEMSNLTCLAQKKVIDHWGTCKHFFQQLISKNALLTDININTIEWLEGKAPEFKAQKNPDWNNAFWIGDALASFYPAIGYGFAHGVNSALCAAHFYLNGNAEGYSSFIKKEIKSKLWMGKLMHRSLMNPLLSNLLLSIIHSNPKTTRFFMRKSGYR